MNFDEKSELFDFRNFVSHQSILEATINYIYVTLLSDLSNFLPNKVLDHCIQVLLVSIELTERGQLFIPEVEIQHWYEHMLKSRKAIISVSQCIQLFIIINQRYVMWFSALMKALL